jgi:DUF4097 and DUF4098 domain-containing protein YvlB
MRKHTKIWLLTAASLILAGGTIFTATACAVNWDFDKFSTVEIETNTHSVSDDFQNISINITTADITLLPSENEICKVVCREDVKEKHSVSVANDTLTIHSENNRKWYDYLAITGNEPIITVYLPKTQYTALAIETDTGDIAIPKDFIFDSVDISGSTCDVEVSASVVNNLTVDVSTGDITLSELTADTINLTVSTGDIAMKSIAVTNGLSIKSSTGDVSMNHVSCKTFTRNSDSGDLKMKNVLVTEKMHVEQSTGDVEFDHCDAGELYIKTSTGDVKGSLLSGKDFHTDSNTGDVKTPPSSEGGKCEIHCSTGDIHITVIRE